MEPLKSFANMCKTGFRAFHGAHSGFQQSSKYIGFMCVSGVRAHPSARRARTCPHLASSWQLLSHKGAQMTSAEPQNDTRRRPNGQKTRPRRPRLTTFVPELVSTDLPPTTNDQPTNQPAHQQSRLCIVTGGVAGDLAAGVFNPATPPGAVLKRSS